MTIDRASIVCRAAGVLSAPVENEIVLLNSKGDTYVGLDPVGCVLWELMEEPCAIEELCRQMSLRFDASPEQIAADVVPLLTTLAADGLVHVET